MKGIIIDVSELDEASLINKKLTCIEVHPEPVVPVVLQFSLTFSFLFKRITPIQSYYCIFESFQWAY